MTSNIHMGNHTPLLNRLHPELVDLIDDWGFDEQILHRYATVILSDLVSDAVVDKINADFIQKKEVAENARAEGRYLDYLMLLETTNRGGVFAEEVAPSLPDDEYWLALRHLWLNHGLPPHWDGDLWFNLYASPRKHRELVMNSDERAVLSVLPSTLTVYRGGVSKNGLSWTLERGKAEFFAKSFSVISPQRGHLPKAHFVLKGTVQKDRVYAYLNGRGDEEIVVAPDAVTAGEID